MTFHKRLSTKQRIPSKAQAKLIARLWGENRCIPISTEQDENDATSSAHKTETICVEQGWLIATSLIGNFPNGDRFIMYTVSVAGIDALGLFLIDSPIKNLDLAESIE